MKKPRSLKNAIESGYIIYNLYAKYNKKIRVDLYHRYLKYYTVSFWIDRDYFKRNYPNSYERF